MQEVLPSQTVNFHSPNLTVLREREDLITFASLDPFIETFLLLPSCSQRPKKLSSGEDLQMLSPMLCFPGLGTSYSHFPQGSCCCKVFLSKNGRDPVFSNSRPLARTRGPFPSPLGSALLLQSVSLARPFSASAIIEGTKRAGANGLSFPKRRVIKAAA